jgi:hypothetical protein
MEQSFYNAHTDVHILYIHAPTVGPVYDSSSQVQVVEEQERHTAPR